MTDVYDRCFAEAEFYAFKHLSAAVFSMSTFALYIRKTMKKYNINTGSLLPVGKSV